MCTNLLLALFRPNKPSSDFKMRIGSKILTQHWLVAMVQYPSRHLSIYLSGSVERPFFTPKFCDAARVPNQILLFFGGGGAGRGCSFLMWNMEVKTLSIVLYFWLHCGTWNMFIFSEIRWLENPDFHGNRMGTKKYKEFHPRPTPPQRMSPLRCMLRGLIGSMQFY